MSHHIKQTLRHDITELENNLSKAEALSEFFKEQNLDTQEEKADDLVKHLRESLATKTNELRLLEQAELHAALHA